MKGIVLSTTVENISSRSDGTIKIVLGTQELSPAQVGDLFARRNKLSTVYIKSEGINQSEIDLVDKVEIETGSKSQSQRIRNSLYVLWEQDNQGYKDFNLFYKNRTELIIEQIKNKIK